jgi:DNA-binding PadR family transcriptional regulator
MNGVVMKELTKAEELVLLTVWRMEEAAYGVAIRKSIYEKTGRDIPYGTLYFILDQLTTKELVYKISGEPTPARGGRSKTYYKLTDEGVWALKASMEMHKKLWGDINSLSFESSLS